MDGTHSALQAPIEMTSDETIPQADDADDTIPLRGRLVLITGVSRREGFGYALARAAASAGARVLLTARDDDRARSPPKSKARWRGTRSTSPTPDRYRA